VRTIGVRLMADASALKREFQGASKTVRDFRGDLDRAAKGGKLDAVTQQAAGLGLGLLGAAAMVTKFSMDFDKQMSAVKAATHGTAKEMEQLRKAAMAAGADTKFSATEAAQGIEELSKAGVSTTSILGGGLTGALDLAAAGGLDVAEAAETAASAMTQFKLKGGDVPHVADLLAAAAGKAQGSVHDMGAALNQSGLVAAQMGLSIEDTVGTLASFASAGLMGSDAGTSLKTAMLMLANPTAKAAGLMEDLGINTYDAQGKFVGITALAGQLKDRLGGLTQEQRNSALATIFGSDAIRAASILYEQGSSGINTWIGKVNDQGYAAETAAIKTDNLAGDIERLTGSLQTLAIQSGGGANGGLRTLTQGMNALVDEFASLNPVVGSTITVLAAVSGGALLLGGAWMKMRASTAEMLTQLREVGPTGVRAASALESTTKWAGRAAIAFAAYEVASAAVNAAQEDLNPQIEALAKGLEAYGQSGALAGESSRLLGKDLGDLEGGFKFLADGDNTRRQAVKNMQGAFEGLVPGLKGTNESLTRTKERVTAMDQAMAQLVAGGNPAAAKAAFDRLAKALAVNGVSMEEFRKQFPAYAAALEVATPATNKAAGSITAVGQSAEDAAEEVKKLNDAFDELFGAQMSIDRANIKVRAGVEALTKELKTGERTIKLNTEEGRKNRSAVLDQVDSINDLRAARLKHGVSLDEANKKYVKDVDGLRAQMRAAGFTKKQIDDLTGAYRKVPGKAETKVAAPGAVVAKKQVESFNFWAREVPKKASTAVSVTGHESAMNKLAQLIVMQKALKKGVSMSAARAQAGDEAAARDRGVFAEGGWTGPGAKYQPAGTVHADEFVIQKASRQRFERNHPGDLAYLNKYGELPGYAGGGQVRWPFPATAAKTRIPSKAEAMAVVIPPPGNWPSSPMAQRGDSGVWRSIVSLIRGTGPMSGAFGNSYRPGDPKWHGSGRAVDWMGYNQDALASFLAARHPLELIHRTKHRDYAYTRGRNKGSFNNSLMEAHRNHIHIAMAGGGVIDEPVFGIGASGKSYSFGEGGRPETVVPGVHPQYLPSGAAGGSSTVTNVSLNVHLPIGVNPREAGRQVADVLTSYFNGGGRLTVRGQVVS
jgi:TP901 family phage tail tape measure protein